MPPLLPLRGGSPFHTPLLCPAAAHLAPWPSHITSATLPALSDAPLVVLPPATTKVGSPFHTALLWSLAPLLAGPSHNMAALLPLLGAPLAVLRGCIPYSGQSHDIAALPCLPGAPLAVLLVVLLLALAPLLDTCVPWLSNTRAHFEQCKLAVCQQARWDQKLDRHLVLSRAHPFDRLCP